MKFGTEQNLSEIKKTESKISSRREFFLESPTGQEFLAQCFLADTQKYVRSPLNGSSCIVGKL